MSRIEQLIAELCPDGVEYRTVNDVCKVSRGRVISKDFIRINHGNYPVYSSQTANDGILGTINSFDFDGEFLTWTTDGAYAGSVFYRNGKFSITNVCGLLEVKENALHPRFLLYYLNIVAKKYVSEGMGNPKLMSNAMAKIPIPIPPLPIQQEIVRILDTFTDLDAELQAELEARKKQFNFYKEKQFNYCKDSVEWRPLGEVGKFQRGKRFVKNDIVSSGIPCIHYGELYTHYKTWTKKTKSYIEAGKAEKLRFAKPGDVIIVTAGETIEDIGNCVAWLGDTDVVIHDACFAYSHNFIPKFVSYYFQTDLFRSQIRRFISSGKISAIHASGLSKATIPIPPLAEQERIVSMLDKFEALVNEELPAEISARRKQYEHYREKLLTFEPPVS